MTDEHIIAYLLQELTAEEAERFEEQCFAHDEWPAELDSAEHELIDAYLRNELSSDRHRRFEENYLITDARKARVLTAQSFLQVLCPSSKPTLKERFKAFWQRPLVPQTANGVVFGPHMAFRAPQITVAVLSLAVLAALLIFFVMPARTSMRLDLAMASPDRSSGPQMPRLTLPLNADALKVYLRLPEPSPPGSAAYRVEWENVSSSLGELKIDSQEDQSIVVTIRANQLSPGSYVLKLFRTRPGETEQHLGNYFFKAEEAAATR